MTLTELPYFFNTATQKVARRSPKPVNIEESVAKGRAEEDTISRAFYVSSQRFAYSSAGFAFVVATVLIALAFREAAQIPVLLLWGIGIGFTGISVILDQKLLKFQLLFAKEPTQQELDEALHKLPSNLTWIIISLVAIVVPLIFFAVFSFFS